MTKNTKTSSAAAPVIEGLADAMRQTKAEKAALLIELQRTAKRAKKTAAKLEAWKIRTAERNPACLVDTVRDVPVGDELPNGLISKGRVVEIACETCSKERTVNVQDAFQVRFCEEHKAEARKAAAKGRRDAAKIAKLEGLDESELDAQIAEAEAAIAAA